MTEVSIWTRGRPHRFAELTAPDDGDDQLALATMAFDALAAVGQDLFEPLAVNVEIVCCDSELRIPLDEPRPAAPFHQLRLRSIPDTVQVPKVWTELVVSRCERLDRDAVLGWFGALLAEQGCVRSGSTTGWSEMLVEAVRARLPGAATALVDGNELPVSHGAGLVHYPVERLGNGLWVAGPLATSHDTAPFEVRIVNEAGVLSMDWSLNWSPWIVADGAGRPDVEAALRRLSALGWNVEPVDRAWSPD
ncbi:hypothetical protein FHX44_113289 [Pseudonocardia hierapolitana]|uniref:Uncharacterized protein n=1 Tax=Pseudonocardia hierapolitana TaxID=1128676 RepID=A0A561SR71_9PSEU|nr:hypothetical protein [Pseudonocardia hierapolitana]TWF77380.1 hypothetical protein FHX44_113289 [Pseudonocardia hierapolitana]